MLSVSDLKNRKIVFGTENRVYMLDFLDFIRLKGIEEHRRSDKSGCKRENKHWKWIGEPVAKKEWKGRAIKNKARAEQDTSDMAGKGDGQGARMAKLENQISSIKYSIFCFNIIAWVGSVFVVNFFVCFGIVCMFDCKHHLSQFVFTFRLIEPESARTYDHKSIFS